MEMSRAKEDNTDGTNYLAWSRFVARDFLPVRIFFNIVFLFYCFLPLSFLQLMPLIFIFMMVLRWLKIPFSYRYSLQDPKKSASKFMRQLKKQRDNFCWLINRMTLRCFTVLSMIYGFFWLVELFLGMMVSWWLFMNLILDYFGATKKARKQLKRWLMFQNEYKTYWISVKEPSSPEKGSDSDSSGEWVNG